MDRFQHFNDIYSKYYRKAFLFTKSYVHDADVAKDIVSDVFTRFWEKYSQADSESAGALLLTMLKNRSLDYLKHRAIQTDTFERLKTMQNRDINLRISSLEECNPARVFSKEIGIIIKATLDTLSPRTRSIFIMSRFENKSNNEIARILHLTTKSIEYHITKSIKALRLALKDYL